VTYTPMPGFRGIDSFSSQAVDAGGWSNVAFATITVTKPTPRLEPSAVWTFADFKSYTTVKQFVIFRVILGAVVHISCAGHGCPLRILTVRPPSEDLMQGQGKEAALQTCETVDGDPYQSARRSAVRERGTAHDRDHQGWRDRKGLCV
jgi:hypothetical protein